ncbi:MAG: hypothetical protein NTY53_07880 [Kiritimatiellaeota bacterium]|nr:hypothetical protein [Kiritimatiellota bacterium]
MKTTALSGLRAAKTFLCLLTTASVFATAAPEMEKQLLFGGVSTKGWSPAESTLEVSAAHVKVNTNALHWHVTVDYYGGEAKYPIGWPRFGRNIPEGEQRDWSAWDFLHAWIFTTSSRAALPKEAIGLGLHTPDKSSAFNTTMSQLKIGEWVEVVIPIAKIARPGDVRNIQFHLSESNYKHADQLDLWIDDLALLRYARPVVLDFAAETAVLFTDAKVVAARFQLAGVKPNATVPVTCELRRAGNVVAQSTVQATRGAQRIVIEPKSGTLTPGVYELTARAADGQPAAPVQLRVVESPWRK